MASINWFTKTGSNTRKKNGNNCRWRVLWYFRLTACMPSTHLPNMKFSWIDKSAIACRSSDNKQPYSNEQTFAEHSLNYTANATRSSRKIRMKKVSQQNNTIAHHSVHGTCSVMSKTNLCQTRFSLWKPYRNQQGTVYSHYATCFFHRLFFISYAENNCVIKVYGTIHHHHQQAVKIERNRY